MELPAGFCFKLVREFVSLPVSRFSYIIGFSREESQVVSKFNICIADFPRCGYAVMQAVTLALTNHVKLVAIHPRFCSNADRRCFVFDEVGGSSPIADPSDSRSSDGRNAGGVEEFISVAKNCLRGLTSSSSTLNPSFTTTSNPS